MARRARHGNAYRLVARLDKKHQAGASSGMEKPS
jgi:hypothetical protein